MATGIEMIVDFDRPADKSRLWAELRTLQGKHRLTVKVYRARRTDPQNRLYWGVVVASLQTFLREQGECYTSEEVHGLMKAKFLRKSIINPVTGEIVGETARSTATLSVDEFSEYLELCVTWLADMFGIVVPSNGSAFAVPTGHD